MFTVIISWTSHPSAWDRAVDFVEENTETGEGNALLTQHKWQELGSDLGPSCITVLPSARTGWRERERKKGLWGPSRDAPQALAKIGGPVPIGHLPDIKASYQSALMKSAGLALEQECSYLRSPTTTWVIYTFYVYIWNIYIFKTLTHLKCIFVYGVTQRSNLIFFQMDDQFANWYYLLLLHRLFSQIPMSRLFRSVGLFVYFWANTIS